MGDSTTLAGRAAPGSDTPAQPRFAEWQRRCERFARNEGFELFVFGLSLPRADRPPVEVLVTNYPAAWLKTYDAHGYIRVDPVVKRLLSSITPFAWDELHSTGGKRAAAFWKRAERHGLLHGYTVPLHGLRGQRAAFGLGGAHALPRHGRSERFSRAWTFAMALFEDVLLAYEHAPRRPPHGRLTRLQREALALVAQGQSVRGIAQVLSRHPRTVEYHLQGALQRLGAATREQAIVRALLGGEIEVTPLPNKLQDWHRKGGTD